MQCVYILVSLKTVEPQVNQVAEIFLPNVLDFDVKASLYVFFDFLYRKF